MPFLTCKKASRNMVKVATGYIIQYWAMETMRIAIIFLLAVCNLRMTRI
jgi:hypothetical protein